MTTRPLARLLMLVPGLLVAGCGSEAAAPLAPEAARAAAVAAPAGEALPPIRLLMVGNSLTGYNRLPEMVAALSESARTEPRIQVGSVVLDGTSLRDQLDNGWAAAEIAGGGWDVVSLQQGPSTLPESRAELIESARAFDVLIRDAGAVPALYGVWPAIDRVQYLDDAIESYRLAAQVVDGWSFPGGLAWKHAWAMQRSLPLYGPDQFHPSVLGSYTVALVIVSVLTGESPVGWPLVLDVAGTRVEIPVAQGAIAQEAAGRAAASAGAVRVRRDLRTARNLRR